VLFPPAAVTATVTALFPTLRLTGPLAAPPITAWPLTRTVAVASAATGVRVRLVVAFGTVTA